MATRSPRPNTLLIDSEQLESGDALDDNFRAMAADEIERFRREIIERTGDRQQAENITDQELLREVMNTVGKQGRLGEADPVRGLGLHAHGRLGCQHSHACARRARFRYPTSLRTGHWPRAASPVLRAQRRQQFNVEYADVLGIPFDFTAKPVIAPVQPPRETIQVKAVRPDRDALEIRFPRVAGYRVELPEERLTASSMTIPCWN